MDRAPFCKIDRFHFLTIFIFIARFLSTRFLRSKPEQPVPNFPSFWPKAQARR